MKLLADENFPKVAIESLRGSGHDVVWALTEMRGSSDASILERARNESRIVLTLDKDFGELAYGAGLPAACGIVLFRSRADSPERLSERVLSVLASGAAEAGQFVVVEENRIRVRPLPNRPRK